MEESLTQQASLAHSLTYRAGEIAITDVKEVISFEDKEIVLALNSGGLTVKGGSLAIAELNLKAGTLKATGTVESMVYCGRTEKGGFMKRLFK